LACAVGFLFVVLNVSFCLDWGVLFDAILWGSEGLACAVGFLFCCSERSLVGICWFISALLFVGKKQLLTVNCQLPIVSLDWRCNPSPWETWVTVLGNAAASFFFSYPTKVKLSKKY